MQSPQAWFDKFNCIISNVSFQKWYIYHYVSIRRSLSSTVIIATYVDNILLIRSDVDGIEKIK